MHSKPIADVIHRLFILLKRSGKRAAISLKPGEIHLFRITYKELRALVRMIGYDQANRIKKTILRRMRRCYKTAGKIRDLQLYQKHINKSKGIQFQSELSGLSVIFTRELKNVNFNKERKKVLAMAEGGFSIVIYKKFILRKYAAITGAMARGGFTDKVIHHLRKNLKDIYYNLRLLEQIDNAVYKNLCNKISLNSIDRLLRICGRFQDKAVAIAMSKKFGSKKGSTKQKQWIKQKEAGRKKIADMLERYFSPA